MYVTYLVIRRHLQRKASPLTMATSLKHRPLVLPLRSRLELLVEVVVECLAMSSEAEHGSQPILQFPVILYTKRKEGDQAGPCFRDGE